MENKNYISRKRYIDKLKLFIDKPVIKVLTGMRRVGKSTLLTMIRDEILKNIPDENKIYLNFESIELFKINEAGKLIEYLKPLLKKDERQYIFFDEIQLVKNWEQVVNGLRLNDNYDIYITGSNSTLISGDLATLLAGRYVEFEIQPFTFGEFRKVFERLGLSDDELFVHFVTLGGMPFLRYFDLDEAPSLKYLADVYNKVLMKDVLRYNNVRDVDLFERILAYVLENIGNTFSANSIKNYFKNENRKVSVDTILNYLEYCRSAFIIKRVSRYDTVGKKILSVDEKYYLTDHGFRAAKGFSNTRNIERTLENIVCIELISRGYTLKIGKAGDKEIDFIAEKDGELCYFQVSYLMGDEATRDREFGVYKNIKDNFPKYVLSMDKVDFSRDGVAHKNIIDFLLEDTNK